MLKQLCALVIKDELIQRSTRFEEKAYLIVLDQPLKLITVLQFYNSGYYLYL